MRFALRDSHVKWPRLLSKHEIEITLTGKHGLHARPATVFVQRANGYESKIEVAKGGLVVDGKSVTSMLTLAAEQGTRLRLIADGRDADQAVKELANLLNSGVGED
jgi:phosphotransferase system HPr (HPr) family protein